MQGVNVTSVLGISEHEVCFTSPLTQHAHDYDNYVDISPHGNFHYEVLPKTVILRILNGI